MKSVCRFWISVQKSTYTPIFIKIGTLIDELLREIDFFVYCSSSSSPSSPTKFEIRITSPNLNRFGWSMAHIDRYWMQFCVTIKSDRWLRPLGRCWLDLAREWNLGLEKNYLLCAMKKQAKWAIDHANRLRFGKLIQFFQMKIAKCACERNTCCRW